MKVAVCTPRCGPASWRFHDSMVQWGIYHARTHPEIDVALLHPERYLPIDVARNLLVELALKSGAEYAWFLDQDAAFVMGTLDRLMSRHMPIVGALEMMRLPGVCYPMALSGQDEDGQYRIQAPEVYEFIAAHYDATVNDPQIIDEPPQGSLLETRFTGFHCLLVRRDVLEAMEPPWCKGYNPGGEDQYFCEKAAALGIPTYVDMSVLVGHATQDRIIGALDFMAGHRFLSEKRQLEQQEEMARYREWRDG